MWCGIESTACALEYAGRKSGLWRPSMAPVKIGVVAAMALRGDRVGYDLAFAQTLKVMSWSPLPRLPMFIVMRCIMAETRMADDLYRMVHLWFGPIPAIWRWAPSRCW